MITSGKHNCINIQDYNERFSQSYLNILRQLYI